MTGCYVRLLQRLIRHPGKVTLVALLIMGGSIYAFSVYNNGVTFFVDTEPKQALVMVRARGNLSPQDKLAWRGRSRRLCSFEGVESVFTAAGTVRRRRIGPAPGSMCPRT